jgi:hypothetical protein
MSYRSKFIAAGAAALFAASSAHAVVLAPATITVPLGSLSTPQTLVLPSEAIGLGAFSYDFTFSTTLTDIFSGSLNYKVLGGTSGLSAFSATIDGHSFAASSGSSRIGPLTAFTNTLSFNASNDLAVGPSITHHLLVSGTAIKAATLNGSFNLVAAPVPEPETYALMLGGLGVLGLLSARRRQV